MALSQIGERMSRAMERMSDAITIDDQILTVCLDDIAAVLLDSDVDATHVLDMQNNVKDIVNDHVFTPGEDKLRFIKIAIFNELCDLFDTGKPSFTPMLRYPCVVMFVGLQGSGKTTACAQYAGYHQKQRWRPGLVLADSFQGSSRDHLIRFADEAKIYLHDSCVESDPVNVINEGVRKFKKQFRDVIIVDTTDRHTDEASLFDEMLQLSEATQPNLVVLVLDSAIGRAAFDQAQAFKRCFPNGAIILTKMHFHSTGLGALSAIAMTKVPVAFVERGEGSDEFEAFEIKPFVNRLLGLDDSFGFDPKLPEFKFSTMYQKLLRRDQEKCERFKTVVMAMTNEELDNLDRGVTNLFNSSRTMMIADTTGLEVSVVTAILEECKQMTRVLTMDYFNKPKNTIEKFENTSRGKIMNSTILNFKAKAI